MSSHVQTKTEILILEIAAKYPSPSVTPVDHLVQEIDSRSGALARELINALRNFHTGKTRL